MAAIVMAGVKADGTFGPISIGAQGELAHAAAIPAAGSITLGAVADGDTITLDDGVNAAIVFEFDDDASVVGANIAVVIGLTPAATAANLLVAIIAAADFAITAHPTTPASATLTLINDVGGLAGNIAVAKAGANITVVGMAGGHDATSLHDLYDALDGLDVTINASDINIGNVDVVSLPALPAGTNNIGDVDVASMPPITGAVTATPPTVALTIITGTCNSAGSNAIIAAPAAGNRLVIHSMQIQLEEVAEQTVLFKSGSTAKRRFIGSAVGEGILRDLPHGKEWRLGTAEALNLDLTVAKIVGYTFEYTTEVA